MAGLISFFGGLAVGVFITIFITSMCALVDNEDKELD